MTILSPEAGAAGIADVARRQERFERFERRLHWPMVGIAVAMLISLLFQALATDLTSGERMALAVADVAMWLLFAVEYLLLLVLAPHKWHFVRTHIPELLLVVVPVLRPVRVLLALTVVVRESRTKLATRGVTYIASLAVAMVLIGAILIVDLERNSDNANITSVGTALWWAAVTVTTIGYGDHFPVTGVGRVVAVVLSGTGIALVGVVTAAVAAWFVRADDRELERELEADVDAAQETATELDALHRRMDELTKAVMELAEVVRAGHPGTAQVGGLREEIVVDRPPPASEHWLESDDLVRHPQP